MNKPQLITIFRTGMLTSSDQCCQPMNVVFRTTNLPGQILDQKNFGLKELAALILFTRDWKQSI